MSFNYDHKSIQMRRGTSSEWREYGDKCVPLEAEICVELMQYPDGTINKNVGVKVGNGIDSYEQLPYVILNEEVDPVFTNHPAYQITQDMIDNWNLSQVEPGEEYGQVTRWDGDEWVPSSIILLKDVEGIEVHRNIVPDEKSRRDIGSEEKPFSRGYFDYLIADDITSKEINVEGSINVEGEVNIDGQIIINNENIGEGLDELELRLEQEIDDRIEGDKNLNTKIDNLATDDLTDVNSANARVDQFLIHNGVQWVAEDFHIDTELTFKGGISVPNDPAPAEKKNGDLYINNEDGVAGASWTGIAGRTINSANAVGWSDTNARWYMLGDIASAAVMRVEAGLGIDVDDAKPAEPVVSIDRAEVDKWYSDINHDHEGLYIEEEVDPTVPQHVKDITTVDISRWDEAHNWGDHSLEGYLKSGDISLPLAANGTRGGVQIGYGENGKNYAVKLSGEQMYVTVPWTDTQNPDYSLPLAANGTRGGVQVGYTTSGKNYAVQLSGEKMYVNVPWTDTNTDLYSYWNLTANGANTTQIGSNATVDFRGSGDTTVTKSGNTITISSSGSSGGGDYTLPLAANGTRGGVQIGFSSSGRNYAVQLSGEKMYVNVPWTDSGNTTYNQATSTTLGLVKIGYSTNSTNRNYAVQLSNGQMYVNVPWVEGSGGGTTYKAGKGIRLDTDTFTVVAGNGLSQDDSGLKMSGSYDGTFAATGDITAYSDEKLKTNITTAPIGVIDQIRGVEFEWKEDGRAGSGVIAQELEKVLPHLVHDRDDGNKSVNYMGLVGYLIEEVKSLKAEVEVLRDASN